MVLKIFASHITFSEENLFIRTGFFYNREKHHVCFQNSENNLFNKHSVFFLHYVLEYFLLGYKSY